jgi:hypothetical protein
VPPGPKRQGSLKNIESQEDTIARKVLSKKRKSLIKITSAEKRLAMKTIWTFEKQSSSLGTNFAWYTSKVNQIFYPKTRRLPHIYICTKMTTRARHADVKYSSEKFACCGFVNPLLALFNAKWSRVIERPEKSLNRKCLTYVTWTYVCMIECMYIHTIKIIFAAMAVLLHLGVNLELRS